MALPLPPDWWKAHYPRAGKAYQKLFDDKRLALISAHIFNETHVASCAKCGLSREMCEDGYHCGRVQCSECTLLRVCVGDPPRCDECYRTIKGASI